MRGEGGFTRDHKSVQAEIPLGFLTHNPFTITHLTSYALRTLPNSGQTQNFFLCFPWYRNGHFQENFTKDEGRTKPDQSQSCLQSSDFSAIEG